MRTNTVIFAAIMAIAGCSSGTGPGSGSELITAAEGGSITLGGGAVVTIAPGALAEDTDVSVSFETLSDFGPLDDALNEVAVLEPAGTVLESPATIVFTPSASFDVSSRARLYQFFDGAWVRPEVGSVELRSDGTIAASVSWFAPTAVTIEEIADPPPLAATTVQVTVVADGAAAAGIPVQLWTAFEEMIGTEMTDAAGVVRFADVSAGDYFAVVSAGGGLCGTGEQSFTKVDGTASQLDFAFFSACD